MYRPFAKTALLKPPFYRVQSYSFFANVASFSLEKMICEIFSSAPQTTETLSSTKRGICENSFFRKCFQCVNKSKSLLARTLIILNNGNLHWFLLLDVRNVLYARIALSAERVDVHPVFALDDDLRQLVAHVAILYVGQHALENTIVHTRADALQQLYHLTAALVVANVVGYDIEMLSFHPCIFFMFVTTSPRKA